MTKKKIKKKTFIDFICISRVFLASKKLNICYFNNYLESTTSLEKFFCIT